MAITIVVVEQLNIKLYQLFAKELLEQNIGYTHDSVRIKQMLDIIQAIDYIQHGNPDKKEIHKIIKIYV